MNACSVNQQRGDARDSATLQRACCPQCLRPAASCVCRWIRIVPSAVEVVILQHPLEVNNPKGTARLLHLSLPHSRIEVGEQFLTDVWGSEASADSLLQREQRTTYLLYPALPGTLADNRIAAQPTLAHQPLRLVVLDATWRKSRKMLYLNPRLQALPQLTLHDLPTSRYRLRKAPRPEHLSTLEATCHALLQLGDASAPIEQLLTAFDDWVTTTQAIIDDHILQRAASGMLTKRRHTR